MKRIKKFIKEKIKWVFVISGLIAIIFDVFSIANIRTMPLDNFVYLSFLIACVMYPFFLLGISALSFLAEIWWRLIIGAAERLKNRSTHSMINVANILMFTVFVMIIFGGVIALIIRKEIIFACYALSVLFIAFPLGEFAKKLVPENEELLLIKLVIQFRCASKYKRIKEKYITRRIVYAAGEIFSARTMILLAVLYAFATVIVKILDISPNEFSVFSYSFSTILAIAFWVFWGDDGAERLRTRQILVKIGGFIALGVCAYYTVFQLSEVQTAAYFASMLTMYFFIESLIVKVIEDKKIFEKRKYIMNKIGINNNLQVSPEDIEKCKLS